MRNKLFGRPLIILMVCLTIFSCEKDFNSLGESEKISNNDDPFLLEAKKFFEQNTIESFTKASARKSQNKGLDPGEFTPRWNKSSISNDNRTKSVDVPIISGNEFKAKHPEVTEGEVDITQTLVVSQNLKTGKMSQYILSLIPEKTYAKGNKNKLTTKFNSSGSKGSYTGLALYMIPVHNIPYMVEKYENGRLIERINLINFTQDKNNLALQRLEAVTGNLQFSGTSTLMTRSGDEESTSYWESFTGWVSDTSESVVNGIVSGAEWIGGEVIDAANRTHEKMESNYSSYEMLNQYMNGTGENYSMKESSWDRVSKYAKEEVGTKYNEGSSFTVDGNTYYQCQVSFYNSKDLGAAFGTSTVYFDSNGNPAGFKDTYDFDPKPWGERSVVGELSTRVGDQLPGESYDINYGVQKPK